MATKKVNVAEEVSMPMVFNLKTITIPIEGISPLIMHKFSEKANKMMKENGLAEAGLKQGGKKKNIADPENDWKACLHLCADGKTYGFPAAGFKQGMVNSGYQVFGKKKTNLGAAFNIVADDKEGNLVKIIGTPQMREDMVRVGTINKVASPRYRPVFPVWGANVTIRYVEGMITPEELVMLLTASGFCYGLGDWRPERNGSFGMYKPQSA